MRFIDNKNTLIIPLFIVFILVISCFVLYQVYLIKNDMAQLITVAEPLEKAVLEMEINIAEASLAVFNYVRQPRSDALEDLIDQQSDFERFSTAFTRLAETDQEQLLAKKVEALYRAHKTHADHIIQLVEQQHAALRHFRVERIKIEVLIDDKLQQLISKTGNESSRKMVAALKMENNINEAFSAIEGYILLSEPEFLLTLADAQKDYDHFEEMYWQTTLTTEEQAILVKVNEKFAVAMSSGKKVISTVDNLNSHLDGLKVTQQSIDRILDNEVQPLIDLKTVYASENAHQSATLANTVIVAGGILSIFIGSLLLSILGRSNNALVSAREKVERILHSAGEGIYGIDSNDQITFANRAAMILTGWNNQELIGQNSHNVLHHSKADGTPYAKEECPIHQSLQDGKEHQVADEVFWRKDGSLFPVDYVSAPIREKQEITGAVVVFRDITEQKRAFEEIHKLSQSVENSPTIVMIADKEARIEYVNSVYTEITNFLPEEIIGHPVNSLIACDLTRKTVENALEKVLQGEKWRGEVLNKKKNGESYWANQIIFPILNHRGEITHIVNLQDDITESKKNVEQLAYLGTHDTLTSLPNRHCLLQRLDDAVKTSSRREQKFALFFMDLDEFKGINDSLGHDAGDELLKIIAKRIEQVLREIDFAARLGGDEFCIIMEEIRDAYDAAQVAERCLEIIAEPVIIAGRKLHPRMSIGITLFPDDGQNSEQLLSAADSAMYAAKHAGKHQYSFYTPELTLLAAQRMSLEDDLRLAIANGDFELYYQPQISLNTGKMMGVEALIRWPHPERGMVQPDKFIHVAERIGLISELGNWVLRTACEQAISWQQAGIPPLRMAVNISGSHFQQGEIVNCVKSLLDETGLAPSLLELEITEDVVQTTGQSIETFTRLKELGVTIAIDDFGTGYSSLSSLKHLPIDCLKIDRVFIMDALTEQSDSVIIATVIAMGQALGLSVLAEGVETIEQVKYLRGVGCGYIQGYYFSKPVPANRIPELVVKNFFEDNRESLPPGRSDI